VVKAGSSFASAVQTATAFDPTSLTGVGFGTDQSSEGKAEQDKAE
jgi:hypothetical protein